ncbi:hypothetical protein [Streptosporangium sp. NBC_01756]|uniref:hypothetical protein n=1 Tax=Streptosporangium sp. NBC_01756 TaxID=2975950 RepID=UPI002DDBF89E|nr:hypothetical protein [Streptosporangium sp. NBC_01756]WSC88937.1 hypothetical protein OIE48_12340 [Streptosporangium sp. NBC_01756]
MSEESADSPSALPPGGSFTGQDNMDRIHDRAVIRALGDSIVDDTHGTSAVSYLEEAGTFPSNMRLGWGALGLLGFPLTQEHDRIVGSAEGMLAGTVQALVGHRDSLHTVSDNLEIAERDNAEHVRRI